jgi:hypothetical protein
MFWIIILNNLIINFKIMDIFLDILVVLLFLVSLICFFLGLIKPSLFSRFFKKRATRKNLSIFFGSVLIILLIIISSLQTKEEIKESLNLVNQAEALINENKIEEALKTLDESIELYDSEKNPAFELKSKIIKSESSEFLKQVLINISDDDFELLEKGELKTSFVNHKVLDNLFIELLQEKSEYRDVYIEEAELKKKQDEEMRKRQEEQAEELRRKQEEESKADARKKEIEKQFSAWDGSHIELTKIIKNSMNDPKSYKHAETSYWDMGTHLIVETKFRGTNAFGGVVLNTARAKASIDGKSIELLDIY